ncbi:uncharacterized protein LOC114875603 isoform X2 [Osmia bicornis bicornis]|uniref:uncharacterized protein LOC114875603 isoform X2 n=1 Tax=Osmia bicornis bicornis TaxID=1437191 RepID=UPI001EAE9968|nr:uncharacterized protein LOC114875603 isoform X2 [Osmia bicornis bicornis]
MQDRAKDREADYLERSPKSWQRRARLFLDVCEQQRPLNSSRSNSLRSVRPRARDSRSSGSRGCQRTYSRRTSLFPLPFSSLRFAESNRPAGFIEENRSQLPAETEIIGDSRGRRRGRGMLERRIEKRDEARDFPFTVPV